MEPIPNGVSGVNVTNHVEEVIAPELGHVATPNQSVEAHLALGSVWVSGPAMMNLAQVSVHWYYLKYFEFFKRDR